MLLIDNITGFHFVHVFIGTIVVKGKRDEICIYEVILYVSDSASFIIIINFVLSI